jgi:hypothetical protein
MRTLLALLLSMVVLAGQATARHSAGEVVHDAARPVVAGVQPAAVRAAAPEVVPAGAVLVPPGAPVQVRTRSGRVVVLPRGCESASGAYDLVAHFHGAPPRVISMFEHAGIDAVLVVINLGTGSGPYEQAFARRGGLDDLLDGVAGVIEKTCGAGPRHVKRIALSSWSAGYGATYRILSHADEAARIDTVLLADGLHVGFRGGYRRVDALQIAPFERFAASAARGDRLMGITHSSIVPPHYASTTETADFLLGAEGIAQSREHLPGPRRHMVEVSRGDRGGLHVRGFSGTGPDDHVDQFYSMGDTLLPLLAARWQR